MDLSLPNTLKRFFVTEIYSVELANSLQGDTLIRQLDGACRSLAHQDSEGQAWSQQQGYVGYTSYGSVKDLSQIAEPFSQLKALIDMHVGIFIKQAELNLGGRSLKMASSWINILDHLGSHSGHFHPHSIISGTFYISVPPGSSGILFEDPRLPMMMNAPTRSAGARPDRQFSASVLPTRGSLLLWESWLRHEVPTNQTKEPRISFSFNYA